MRFLWVLGTGVSHKQECRPATGAFNALNPILIDALPSDISVAAAVKLLAGSQEETNVQLAH